MELLIDNYDSFTYNLYQLIGRLTPDVRVIKNDDLTVAAIKALQPDHIILSPGPGTPAHTGVSPQVVQQLAGQVPILGICMGLEVMVTAFGGFAARRPAFSSRASHVNARAAVITI